METYRTVLFLLLAGISIVLYTRWMEFSAINQGVETTPTSEQASQAATSSVPDVPSIDDAISSTPTIAAPDLLNSSVSSLGDSEQQIIRVETDLLIVEINPLGGVIERVELKAHPADIKQPDIGYALIKSNPQEHFVVQDGLLFAGQKAENNLYHNVSYSYEETDYQLGYADQVVVPLSWARDDGVSVTKRLTFKRNSYVLTYDYLVENQSANTVVAYQYGQFERTEPESTGGGFGQIPSFTGAAVYTDADKYQKVSFDELEEKVLDQASGAQWLAMMQHYFVAAWLFDDADYELFSKKNGQKYIALYRQSNPAVIAAQSTGELSASVFIGPKEQDRLKLIEEQNNIEGLPLTVDYGFLTFIADPLFWALNNINKFINNWGWSIIILTFLIKLIFYPLSAASYKSMAGMKKLQPRIQTLKERYKDDRQKFQMEMMELYKKEKINPAGGCLPILIQIPVFIALYWVLLESVEIRQAPFALWLQDLSAPDPFYVLPVLMGLSMWVQQKLNPAPVDDIQKKVFMIMPFALTLLFLTFPAGLVLYWVVNNVLSMAQQWFINKKHAE